MLFIAGDQAPEIPFIELVGNALIVVPEQKGPNCVNNGIVFGVIVTVLVCVKAHCPAEGVKV